jgi:hypothetical protein
MTTPGPPSGFASDPQLIMLWTTPPDLTGAGMKPGNSDSKKMPPQSMPFSVDLASLQSAVQSMLDAGSTVVSTYNPVEQLVQQAVSGGTIFGQQATYNTMRTPVHGWPHPEYNVPDAQLQSQAQQYAAEANPAMTRVLRAMADAMETVGVFMAMVSNAGQRYTASDKNSAIPPAPIPGGGS